MTPTDMLPELIENQKKMITEQEHKVERAKLCGTSEDVKREEIILATYKRILEMWEKERNMGHV